MDGSCSRKRHALSCSTPSQLLRSNPSALMQVFTQQLLERARLITEPIPSAFLSVIPSSFSFSQSVAKRCASMATSGETGVEFLHSLSRAADVCRPQARRFGASVINVIEENQSVGIWKRVSVICPVTHATLWRCSICWSHARSPCRRIAMSDKWHVRESPFQKMAISENRQFRESPCQIGAMSENHHFNE